jgi:hypothetical protein
MQSNLASQVLQGTGLRIMLEWSVNISTGKSEVGPLQNWTASTGSIPLRV